MQTVKDRILTSKEAALLLGCSVRQVGKIAVSLGGWKIGDGPKGDWRFLLSRIESRRNGAKK